MIIGLTGKNAAGKGETAKYLEKKGFVSYSLSDVIRDECKNRNFEPTRDNMINVGNELRQKNSPNYLAVKINEKIKNQLLKNKNTSFAIDSIRSPYEAKELMKNEDFILVSIDAPINTRLERIIQRNRIGDPKTLNELKEKEERENLNKDTNQQLDNTIKLAQKTIANDSTFEALYRKIDCLIL